MCITREAADECVDAMFRRADVCDGEDMGVVLLQAQKMKFNALVRVRS